MQSLLPLLLLITSSLSQASHINTNVTLLDKKHLHNSENTTHGPLLSSITACVLPHCYDIKNDTANNNRPSNDDVLNQSIGSSPPRNSNYETNQRMDNIDLANRQPYAINIDDRHWASSSVMYGLLTIDTKNYVNAQCYNELRQIYNGIRRKETWAIKGQ